MKKENAIFSIIKITFLLSLLLILSISLKAQSASEYCVKNSSFGEGERLTFKVYYNMSFIWINSGSAEFSIESGQINGHDAYHIVGIGKTASSFEYFYKVKDKYETYIDKQTLLPIKFARDVNEGGMKFNNEVTFDHADCQVVSDKKTYKIPKNTQDVLSAMYFARNIDYDRYKPGDKIPFSMFLDNQVYNLYVQYLGKEEIKTKMGTFNSIKIKPLLIQGTIFKDGDKMTVWISDDKNHIPLRVESPILIGSVKIDLMEYANLKNPCAGMISKN